MENFTVLYFPDSTEFNEEIKFKRIPYDKDSNKSPIYKSHLRVIKNKLGKGGSFKNFYEFATKNKRYL